jgi:hypothetical protein
LSLRLVVDERLDLAVMIEQLESVAMTPFVLKATDETDIFLLHCLRQLCQLWKLKNPWKVRLIRSLRVNGRLLLISRSFDVLMSRSLGLPH